MGFRGALSVLVLFLAAGEIKSATAATCYLITSSHQVFTFQTGSPSVAQNSVAISGLSGTEAVVGCDIRPATGQLYMITVDLDDNGRIYTLNPSTGVATFVVQTSQKLSGGFYAMDFNPVVDRIRVITGSLQNVRINPTTGEVIIDSSISYATGDPNQAAFPSLFGCAYTNNFSGAGTTELYGIDTGTDALVRINPPNGGILNTVGSLDTDAGGHVGFDIAPSPVNHAYAVLSSGLNNSLFLIDLGTGHAVSLGTVPGGSSSVYGFTVAPGYQQSAFSRSQTIRIVSNGVGYQELSYNYTTGETLLTPYNAFTANVQRLFPFVEWSGVFHYDYGQARFTEAVYSRQHPL